MLVNARLLYILVDGLHYSSSGQVISTVTCYYVSDRHCLDRWYNITVHSVQVAR